MMNGTHFIWQHNLLANNININNTRLEKEMPSVYKGIYICDIHTSTDTHKRPVVEEIPRSFI